MVAVAWWSESSWYGCMLSKRAEMIEHAGCWVLLCHHSIGVHSPWHASGMEQ